jgi:PAS domain S-box-containing protein
LIAVSSSGHQTGSDPHRESLVRSEARLKEAQRLAHTGSWELDLVRNVLTWSDEIYRIFEIDPAGFGASYEAFLATVHPDDRAVVHQAYTDSIKNRTPYAIIHRLQMKDGRIKYVQERGETFYDPAGRPGRSIGTVQDVTERQRIEEESRQLNATLEQRVIARTRELAEERAMLAAIFDSVNVGMLLVDQRGRVERFNRVVMRWTGRVAPPADRNRFGDVLGCMHARESEAGCGTSPACAGCLLQKAFTGALQRGESAHGVEVEATLERDGQQAVFWFELNADPVRLDGVTRAVICLNDVTERKRSQLDVEKLNHQLAQRARELESVNRELEAFAHSVSHDLRAPLRAIDGFSRILQRDYADTLGAVGCEHLQRVRGASQRMGQLIDGLLQLSRTARASLLRTPVNLTRFAEAIFAELRHADPTRTVLCIAAPGLVASADPVLIRAVLENLLGNAWKFTAGAAEARIEFGATTTAGERVFFVRDNGAGFDMTYVGRLFGPFQRLHSDAEFPGTGIGLATTQRIIHRHGGRIWAEGKPGAGATFSFTLPDSPGAP